MRNAEESFTAIYYRVLTRGLAVVTSLRMVTDAALADAIPNVEAVLQILYDDMIGTFRADPQLGRIVSAAETMMTAVGADCSLRESMTKNALTNARLAIDAASLVFTHSVLEDALLGLCEVSALSSPDDWESEIKEKERKFELEEIKGRTYADLLKDAIRRRLARLKKESLVVKAELLHRVCQVPKGLRFVPDYTFDRERIVAIDKRRIDVVHGAGPLGLNPSDIEGDIDYVTSTIRYFFEMVRHRYGIRVSPETLRNLIMSSSTSSRES